MPQCGEQGVKEGDGRKRLINVKYQGIKDLLTADKSGHGEDKTEVDRTFYPLVTVVAGALCGLMAF